MAVTFVVVTRNLEKVSVAAIAVAVEAIAVAAVPIGGPVAIIITIGGAAAVAAAVAVTVAIAVAILVRVLNGVLQLRWQRWVAHTVGLRRGDVVAIVGSSSVHGSPSIGYVRTWSARSLRRNVSRGRGTTAIVRCETRLTLLDLALDAATIWRLTNTRQDRTHGLDQVKTKVGWSKLKSGLDDIIAVGVAHKLFEFFLVHHFFDHNGLDVQLSAADTLLDDVGAELLSGQLRDVTLETQAKRGSEGHVVQVEDVLHDIVAKRILDELEAIGRDLTHKLNLLEAGSVVDAALKDTATVAVGTNSNAILTNSIKDELSIFGLEVVETLLDDMVAVEVLDKSNDFPAERIDNHLDL